MGNLAGNSGIACRSTEHGLSQQGIWVPFLDTKTLKKNPSGHPNIFVWNF